MTAGQGRLRYRYGKTAFELPGSRPGYKHTPAGTACQLSFGFFEVTRKIHPGSERKFGFGDNYVSLPAICQPRSEEELLLGLGKHAFDKTIRIEGQKVLGFLPHPDEFDR